MRAVAFSAIVCIAPMLGTLAACSSHSAQCSAQSKLVGGLCRPLCTTEVDCVLGERCDPSMGVCVANHAPTTDGGTSEGPIGPPDGGGDNPDASMHGPVKADILFVIQNSAPMAVQAERLSNALAAFLDPLQGKVEYQIGVVTTDLSSATGEREGVAVSTFATDPPNPLLGLDTSACTDAIIAHGCFRGPDPSNRLVTSAIDPAGAVGHLQMNVNVGNCGSGIEQGLKGAITALQNARGGGCNQGFLRDDAELVLILFADENDTDATPVATYADMLSAFRTYDKIRVAVITAAENGVATKCNEATGSSCGVSACASMPPAGSHLACATPNDCASNEQCVASPGGGLWCENPAVALWDPVFCAWCAYFNTADCCDALATNNPVMGAPGRYVDFARAVEMRVVAANAMIPKTACSTSGSGPAGCLVETICQTDYGASMRRIAERLIVGAN
jgi:hypothetical protein